MTSWGAGLAEPPVQGHRPGWGQYVPPAADGPGQGWTGHKSLAMGSASAAAMMLAPTVRSSARVKMPAGRSRDGGFPYRFPFRFSRPVASMVVHPHLWPPIVGGMPVDIPVPTAGGSAEMLPPAVVVAAPDITPPSMTADAAVTAPSARVSQTVRPQTIGGTGFPYRFPFRFGRDGTRAHLTVPTVLATLTCQPPPMLAAAVAVPPGVRVSVTAALPPAQAAAVVWAPSVGSGVTVGPPVMTVHVALSVPAAADGDLAVTPQMTAAADMRAPAVGVTETITVTPPTIGGRQTSGFPYRFPFRFPDPADRPARAELWPPNPGTGYTVTPPPLSAAAATTPPTIRLGYQLAVPRKAGTAGMPAPSAHSGTRLAVPRASATAAMWPTAMWLSPIDVVVTASQRVEVPRWCRYIDIILLGGGAGGADGSLISSGNGGRPGTYANVRYDRQALPKPVGSINVSIGAAGTRSGNAGGTTQIWLDDYGPGYAYADQTMTAAGGSGTTSPRDAAGPGNRTFNAITAIGGTGNSSIPGSGGRGGPSGLSGRNADNGARGQVWIRFSI